jgi:hypothetical protein
MFFIVNKTKEVITIQDLRIVLGPRQAIDLDGHVDRGVSENSKDLKKFISKGIVEIKRKDISQKEVSNHIPQLNNTIDINKMKDEILQGVRDSMSELLKPQIPPVSFSQENSNISTEELARMIAGLINNSDSNNIKEKKKRENAVTVDENILADMHSKTMDKKMKNIRSGDIAYDIQTSKNTIDSNISELENLLD